MPLPADISLLLLGTAELHADGRVIAGHAKPRLLCLLAYLAVEGGAAKSNVAALFWPDAPPSSARTNLRQLLRRLRGELGAAAALLEAPGDTLALAAGCHIDVRLFLAGQRGPDAPDAAAQAAQLALYRGPFLEGLPLEGCGAGLADWIAEVRRRCRTRAGMLAAGLATRLARQEKGEAALPHALHALALDPANQEALHLAMLLYSRGGAAPRALALYREWERKLVQDAGALPAPETHALYQQIRKSVWESQGTGGDLPVGEFTRRVLTVLAVYWPPSDLDSAGDAAAEACESLYVRCGAVLARFGAHVASLPQGGLLAWFGYPASQAQSAATALRAVADLRRQVPETAQMALALHAGSTLCNARAPDVGGALARAVLGLGMATEPGSLAASPACFAALDQPHWLLAAPAMAGEAPRYLMQWQAWRGAGSQGGRQAPRVLAGRAAELARLRQCWQAARRGACTLVQVGGAAGMGKSHLLRAFLAETGPAWILHAQCDQFSSDTPLHAVLPMFAAAAREPGGLPVRQAMARHVPLPAEARRGLGAGWQAAGPVTLEALEQVIAGLAAAVRELAAIQPLVVAIDDVQWADSSTLALLASLARLGSSAATRSMPVLVLVTTRGAEPLWSRLPACRMELGVLDPGAAQDMVRDVNPALDAAHLARVLAVGGGHPLFLSELARRGDERELPASIGELVQARLDDLGAARKLAYLAAVLGLVFRRAWLQAVAAVHDVDGALLDTLLQSGLLKEAPQQQLAFSHALLRDAVAASLPERHFRELSLLTGETLASRFAADLESTPELAAHWFTDAHAWQSALAWRLKACRLAVSYAAYPETVREMEAGLALLPHLMTREERDGWEREFRVLCHQAVTPVLGVHSDASVLHYRRLAQLAETAGGLPLDYDAMRALMYATEARHGQRALRHLLRRLLRLPHVQAGDGGVRLLLQESMVHASILAGRIRPAATLHKSLLHTPWPALSAMPASLPHDPLPGLAARGVMLAMLSGAWTDDAASEREMLAAARSSSKPLTLPYVLTFLILAYLPARMPRRLAPLADELLDVSEKQGLAVFRLVALLARASGRVQSGDHSVGDDMDGLLAGMRHYAAFCCPGFLPYLAEARLMQGQTGLALAALRQGEEDMARYGMLVYRAEYLVLRARMEPSRAGARRLLDKACRIAMRQGVRLPALRGSADQLSQPDHRDAGA